MIRDEEVYKIGLIGKAHGVKGEVTMRVDDDVFYRVDADYLILRVDGIMVPFFIEEYRFKTDTVALIKIDGIDSVEKARTLTGTEVFFRRDMADAAEEQVLSYAQLVGYKVINSAGGACVGEIASVDEQTINIMFELTDGVLLPAAEELIEDIDNDNRTITLRIADGLL